MLWKKIDMLTVKRKKLGLHEVRSHRKPCWGKGCLRRAAWFFSWWCWVLPAAWRVACGEGRSTGRGGRRCEKFSPWAGTPLCTQLSKTAAPQDTQMCTGCCPNSCWAPQAALGASSGPGKNLPVPLIATATCGALLPFLLHPCVSCTGASVSVQGAF